MVRNMFLQVRSVIWPDRCPICSILIEKGNEHEHFGLCPDCHATIKPLSEPLCKLCGRTLDKETGPVTGICGFCLKDPPKFDMARGYADYHGALARLIKDFKFKGRRKAVHSLARIIIEAEQRLKTKEVVDAAIPVPLHNSRLSERGFNQAMDLARAVAQKRGIPVMTGELIRVRPTEPQFGLSAAKRKENMRGAFKAKNPEIIRGKRFLLVDDIITTGATVNECARILKKAGAEKVYAVALANRW